ncbi:ABC transporter substrate-binding protein [Pseudoclavibacter endophyticus]|uniref:ABC transporter substrate-binding protein n=2 Tax=Pseudoclavibacter endophyticus TaxID=1778590 RepID=A0A6H9WB39_9MICO|nr:ABC transporter substrate-binding protein [Pseudoclavibacter endophyticus]
MAASAAAVAIVAALAACSPGETERTTLVYATGDAEPSCLDPHVGGNWPQALVGNQFVESLFSRNDGGEIIPWLATGASEADDGLSWDIALREGVTFTDGTPFDAEAVRANVEHLKDPATASSTGVLALGKVERVVAVDEHTARFELSEPDGALIESLAQTWTGMMSPAGFERGIDENCQAPIGTGPFIVESWQPQDSITLVRNDDYASPPADASNQGPAHLERIEWRFIPDAASRLAALQSGQVDVIDSVQPDALAAFGDDDAFSTATFARPGVTARIELNTTRAPFEDATVREAFALSMNLDPAIDSLFAGTLDRSTSLLSSSLPFAASFPDRFVYDPDRANALLDEAGWTARGADGIRTRDGERLTVAFPVSTNQSIPAEVSLLEQIAATAAEVGFDVRLELLDLATWYERSGSWEFDAIIAPYSKSSPDVLRTVYHSMGIPPAPSGYHANNTGLSDPALDALLDEASQASDDAVRGPLYGQAQQAIAETGMVIPLYDQMVQLAYSTDVQGFRLQPQLGTPTFLDVTIGR